MTLELQTALQRQLADAEASGKIELIVKAQCAIMLGLLDCQRKTSDRVKWLVRAMWVVIAAVAIVACGGEEVVVRIGKVIVGA